jgi:hypothetical protein
MNILVVSRPQVPIYLGAILLLCVVGYSLFLYLCSEGRQAPLVAHENGRYETYVLSEPPEDFTPSRPANFDGSDASDPQCAWKLLRDTQLGFEVPIIECLDPEVKRIYSRLDNKIYEQVKMVGDSISYDPMLLFEVFTKESAETIEEAIERVGLRDIPSFIVHNGGCVATTTSASWEPPNTSTMFSKEFYTLVPVGFYAQFIDRVYWDNFEVAPKPTTDDCGKYSGAEWSWVYFEYHPQETDIIFASVILGDTPPFDYMNFRFFDPVLPADVSQVVTNSLEGSHASAVPPSTSPETPFSCEIEVPFEDEGLGVRFVYCGDSWVLPFEQEGNRISMGPFASIEVFHKSPEETIENAIKRVAFMGLPTPVFEGCAVVPLGESNFGWSAAGLPPWDRLGPDTIESQLRRMKEVELYELSPMGPYHSFLEAYYRGSEDKPSFDDCGSYSALSGERLSYFEYHPHESKNIFAFVRHGLQSDPPAFDALSVEFFDSTKGLLR